MVNYNEKFVFPLFIHSVIKSCKGVKLKKLLNHFMLYVIALFTKFLIYSFIHSCP